MGAYVVPVLIAVIGGIGSLYAAWVQLRTKREDGATATGKLLDERYQKLLDRLTERVDELEGENRDLRTELKTERTARQRLEGEVSTLRAQLAKITGLAAGAEADTAGGTG